MAPAWLKSIATSQFFIAGSIGSPRSHCATISISGSSLARSATVFPMRPAAPTSNTRTGDFFIKAKPSPYPLLFEGRGDLRLHLESRSRHTLRSGSVGLSPRGERIEVRVSFVSLKFLERFAQSRLVRLAHLAQRQTNFARHRAAPAECRLHRNRVWLDEQVFKQRQQSSMQFRRRFQVA